jgi:hypothetical protein
MTTTLMQVLWHPFWGVPHTSLQFAQVELGLLVLELFEKQLVMPFHPIIIRQETLLNGGTFKAFGIAANSGVISIKRSSPWEVQAYITGSKLVLKEKARIHCESGPFFINYSCFKILPPSIFHESVQSIVEAS